MRKNLGNEIRDHIHDCANEFHVPMTTWQAAKIAEHLIEKYRIIPHDDWPWIEANIISESRS